ncbi:sensor histidine kinase [Spirosoma panaciterrae]|uniref:sensor histidine kinase n=1 Tax=Spirosoma panaciterrae TaxID=496058 RepID=UPI000376616F|nr:histidine kinase [Spirosoma panaciterrae]
MKIQSHINQSTQDFILGFYESNRQTIRGFWHILMWIAVYFLLIRSTAPRIFEDNTKVINTASFVDLLQTIVLYYLIGYYIFPRLFYQRYYATLLLSLVFIFFCVYQLNYNLFYYLASISTQNQQRNTYAIKIATMLKESGWLGCFTNLRISLWNLSYGFFLPMLLLVFKAFRDIITYQKRIVTVERDKFELELSFLKAQVNPHFLFNTLNSIYADIFDTNEKAADLVLRLSELMRYNLYETDSPKIALDKELAYIQNYLDLERNRLSDQYVVIDYKQSGNSSIFQITPLLLIAFVENAFKHGIKGTTEPAYVQVRTSLLEDQLIFQVENSIPLKRPLGEPDKKSGGIGLDNIRRRLEALYKGNYELITNIAATTYTVTLKIKVEPLP